MAERTVISAHTKPEVSERLGKLAAATNRSKSYLAGEAIERYLAEEETFLQSIERGLSQAEAGAGVSSSDAKAELSRRLEARTKPASA